MAIRLQDRDRQILRHIGRYRLSTPEIVHRLFYEPEGADLEAAKSTLRRFWQDPENTYIESASLYGQGREVYYYLTPLGARTIGIPEPQKVGVPDMEFRARLLGCLLFCCAKTPRPKFTVEEFEACFPGVMEDGSELQKRFFHDAYYLDVDESGVRRLGRIIVDGGRNAVETAQRAVNTAAETVPRFVYGSRFALALVFPNDQKLRRVRHALHSRPLEPEVRLIFEAQPDVGPLVNPQI
jgi:hypothetical protein